MLGITLDTAARSRLGVTVAPLAPASYRPHVDGAAVVVDSQSIIGVASQLASARAQARIGNAAQQRAERLYQADATVSRDVLEAATRQAATDRAALRAAQAQALAAFGSGAPWLGHDDADHDLTALLDGTAVVVRASFPAGLPNRDPADLVLRRPDPGTSPPPDWKVIDVWIGPSDPQVPGPMVFAWVEPAGSLVSGERLAASLPTGGPLRGVVVPASAVVFAGSAAWCYRDDGSSGLLRQQVDLDRPDGDGYFQTRGFDPGQRIVIHGAGLLLGYESSAAEETD